MAVFAGMVGQAEQGFDLCYRKPKLSASANKFEALHGGAVVAAVTIYGTLRLCEQADAFIVANSFYIDARIAT